MEKYFFDEEKSITFLKPSYENFAVLLYSLGFTPNKNFTPLNHLVFPFFV